MTNNPTVFDKTDIYETEIAPLVEKLRIACSRNSVPMFVSICPKSDKDETIYHNDMISAISSNIRLKDDKFIKYVNVLNGFETIPKRTNDVFDEFDNI